MVLAEQGVEPLDIKARLLSGYFSDQDGNGCVALIFPAEWKQLAEPALGRLSHHYKLAKATGPLTGLVCADGFCNVYRLRERGGELDLIWLGRK